MWFDSTNRHLGSESQQNDVGRTMNQERRTFLQTLLASLPCLGWFIKPASADYHIGVDIAFGDQKSYSTYSVGYADSPQITLRKVAGEWQVECEGRGWADLGIVAEGRSQNESGWMQFYGKNGEIRFREDGDNAIHLDWFRIYNHKPELVILEPISLLKSSGPYQVNIDSWGFTKGTT